MVPFKNCPKNSIPLKKNLVSMAKIRKKTLAKKREPRALMFEMKLVQIMAHWSTLALSDLLEFNIDL